jgi:hypothetical protein
VTIGAAVAPAAAVATASTVDAAVRRRGRAHRTAGTLVHELPAAGVMALACAAGNAAALCAGAVALALLACGYGRIARRSPFAREHVVDLWAMLLVMVGMAFSAAPVPAGVVGSVAVAPHRHLASVGGPVGPALVAIAVVGWLIGRLLLARRVRLLHTAVSAAVCGGMLVAMLAM